MNYSYITLGVLKLGLVCVTNFGESPNFLDMACLAKTRNSQFFGQKSRSEIDFTHYYTWKNHPAWFFKQLDTHWLCQMGLFYARKTMQLKLGLISISCAGAKFLCNRSGRIVTSKSIFFRNEFNGTFFIFIGSFCYSNFYMNKSRMIENACSFYWHNLLYGNLVTMFSYSDQKYKLYFISAWKLIWIQNGWQRFADLFIFRHYCVKLLFYRSAACITIIVIINGSVNSHWFRCWSCFSRYSYSFCRRNCGSSCCWWYNFAIWMTIVPSYIWINCIAPRLFSAIWTCAIIMHISYWLVLWSMRPVAIPSLTCYAVLSRIASFWCRYYRYWYCRCCLRVKKYFIPVTC